MTRVKYILMSVFAMIISLLLPDSLHADEKMSVFDVIVAQDGSGDYISVQEAINAAPSDRTEPWLIFVKNGSYHECVVIPEDKPYLHLIGQDREKTIIHYSLNVGKKPEEGQTDDETAYWQYSVHNPVSDVYKRLGCVVTVFAADFYTENITYANDYGVDFQKGPQALAMNSIGDRASFYNCAFRSFQDTWKTTTNDSYRHYVKDCWIEGAVDYFYGGGDVLLEECTLYNVRRASVIVAPCQDKAKYGYVFRNCIVDGNEKSKEDSLTKLGRPWHNSPKAVYIHTVMKIPVAQEGWTNMGAVPALFAEYDSRDAEGNVIDLSHRKTEYVGRGEVPPQGSCRATITKEEADAMTYDAIICANDGWDPRSMMQSLPAPQHLALSDGTTLVWEAVPEAIGYVVIVKDEVVGFTKTPSFSLTDANQVTAEDCKVYTVNKYGSLGK